MSEAIETKIRQAKYLIALDLGSESSTCCALDRSNPNDIRTETIDLQYFAQAFAPNPVILYSGNKPSLGIRSRYFWNSQVEPEPSTIPTESESTFGFNRVLAIDESRKKFIPELDRYLEGKENNPHRNISQNIARSVMTLFSDSTNLLPMSASLLNSKLAFLGGLSTNIRCKTSRDQLVTVMAPELLQIQIGLILENFVKYHPFWGDQPLDWNKAALILTVPNTYSPAHVKTLEAMVGDVFSCPVKAISESDAVAFYAREQVVKHLPEQEVEPVKKDQPPKPPRNRALEILTLDIGRGTSDASYMRYFQAVPEGGRFEKVNQKIRSRAGVPAGGAYLTYQIVKFIEEIVFTVASSVDSRYHSFQIFTQESKLRNTVGSYTKLINYLDEYVDGVKRSWYESHNGAVALHNWNAGDLAKSLTIGTVLYLNAQATGELEGTVSFDLNDLKSDPSEAVLNSLLGSKLYQVFSNLNLLIVEAQNEVSPMPAPVSFWELFRCDDKKRWAASVKRPWDQLRATVKSYVHANVDGMICDIVSECPEISSIKPTTSAEEALNILLVLLDSDKNGKFDNFFVLLTSGQASLFQPIQKRVAEIARSTRLEVLDSPTSTENKIDSKNIWDEFKTRFKRKKPASDEVSPDRKDSLIDRSSPAHERGKWSIFLPLPAKDCKNACVQGALLWASTLPVAVNPKAMFGGIRVSQKRAAEYYTCYFSMDDIASGKAKIEAFNKDGIPVLADWTLHYVPNELRVKDDKGTFLRNSTVFLDRFAETTIFQAHSITLAISNNPEEQGVPVVNFEGEDDPGSVTIKEGFMGIRSDNDQLLPLLWPSRMKKP